MNTPNNDFMLFQAIKDFLVRFDLSIHSSGLNLELTEMLNSSLVENNNMPVSNITLIDWIRHVVDENLDGLISAELRSADNITYQTWRIISFNIAKILKDLPQMKKMVEDIENTLSPCVENITLNLLNEPSTTIPYTLSHDILCDNPRKLTFLQQLQYPTNPSNQKLSHSVEMFSTLLNSQLSDVVSNKKWSDISLELLNCLCCDSNTEFKLSLQVHAKLTLSGSPSLIKEGFINLTKGLKLYYSRKFNSSYSKSTSGINFNIPPHLHIVKISHLILETVKELPKNWVRYGERYVEEIMETFLTLITFHTYDSYSSKVMKIPLYPFHIISLLDPTALWCTWVLHDILGQNILFINFISHTKILLKSCVDILMCYINVRTDFPIPFQKLTQFDSAKYAIFVHSSNLLKSILTYEKGLSIFCASQISLHEFLSLLIKHVNNHGNVETYSLEDKILGLDIIVQLLSFVIGKWGCRFVNDGLIKDIIEPIQPSIEFVMHKTSCLEVHHTATFILSLLESDLGVYCLWGFSPKWRSSPKKLPNNTTQSAPRRRKSEALNVSSARQLSTKSLRLVPTYTCTNIKMCPAKVVINFTTTAIKSRLNTGSDVLMNLLNICGKLLMIHEGILLLDANECHLISSVSMLYKHLSHEEYSYTTDFSKNNVSQTQFKHSSHSKIPFQCLLSFILRLSSTPKGVALLLSENGLIEDVLRVQMCSPYVPWEDAQFRGAVSLLGATTEGVAVLSRESSGILRDSLNRLWAAYEDPEFMLSSNTIPIRAMQDFINVLCSLTATFQGVVALLSERDDESSDETLVEFVGPTKLSELLTFESCVEPWHYVGLLTLRLLTSDLNVCLYLSNKLNFQDHLLKLQSENTINSEFDNSTLNSSCDETDMIIDAHSLLRHQILVATYVVGGPSERTLPSTELYEELDGEESVPFLFSSYPPPQPYFKKAEVSPKTQTELHKFLKETRHGPHDSGWLLHARKAYRLSCHNDIKPLVLLDLFYQTAKCFYSDVTHQVDWSNVIPDTLFPAELEGIQLTIRYGVNCGLLQAWPQNFDNLAYLLKQSHGSNGTPSSFEGFDWFLATAFLVSGGNLDRCYLLLNNIICLPTSKYMWSNNHSFESDSTFGHLLECVVSAELPQCFAALQTSGVSWWLVCRRWIRQCFWNVLDWQQICHWLALCSLESPDYIVYFCVSLLRHLQPSLLIASANQQLCDTIKTIPLCGFKLSDQIPFMENLSRQYHTSLLQYFQNE